MGLHPSSELTTRVRGAKHCRGSILGKSIATAVIIWRRGFVLGKMGAATAMNTNNNNSNNPTDTALRDIKGPSPQLADLYTEPSSNQSSSVNSGGIGQIIEGVHPTVKGDLDNYECNEDIDSDEWSIFEEPDTSELQLELASAEAEFEQTVLDCTSRDDSGGFELTSEGDTYGSKGPFKDTLKTLDRIDEIMNDLQERMKKLLTKDDIKDATRAIGNLEKPFVAATENLLTSSSEPGITKEITLEPGIIRQMLNGTCEKDITPLVQVVKIGSQTLLPVGKVLDINTGEGYLKHHTFEISDGHMTTTVSCTFDFADYIQNSETDLHNSIIRITKFDSSPSWYDKGYQHISIKSFEVVTQPCNIIRNPSWSVLDNNAISKTLMYVSVHGMAEAGKWEHLHDDCAVKCPKHWINTRFVGTSTRRMCNLGWKIWMLLHSLVALRTDLSGTMKLHDLTGWLKVLLTSDLSGTMKLHDLTGWLKDIVLILLPMMYL